MKRVLSFFLLLSCLTVGLFATEKISREIAPGETYTINLDYIDDLVTPKYMFSTFIFVNKAKGGVDCLTLSADIAADKSDFNVYCLYSGPNWRFMKGPVRFSFDGKVVSYTDDNPYRKVGDEGNVFEALRLEGFNKTSKLGSYLRDSRAMRIQYYGEPITLTEQQVNVVHDFMTTVLEMSFPKAEEFFEKNK